jgi:hypothetical protein
MLGAVGIYAIGTGVGILYFNSNKNKNPIESKIEEIQPISLPTDEQRRTIFNQLAHSFDSGKTN